MTTTWKATNGTQIRLSRDCDDSGSEPVQPGENEFPLLIMVELPDARHACALRRSIASPTIAISSRPEATLDDSNAAMTADNRRSSRLCNPSRLRRDQRNAREPIVGVQHPGRLSSWRQSQLLRTTLIADANSLLSAISLNKQLPMCKLFD
jgi:hypothetical protein